MTEGRRPLAVRGTGWAQAAARRLTARGVAPDTISKASLVFAAAAFACFWAAGQGVWPFLLVGAACVQGRLLCNLFDGMVAVEGGRGGPEGPFWNEVPDRPADLLILTGAGLACGSLALGLAAGGAALMTAYLRAMSVALGRGEDFGGPFAKQQRMAAVTVAALIGAAEAAIWGTAWAMTAALWLVTLGGALTAWLRGRRLLSALAANRAE
ncbi:hypothetical protein [Jannaschia aquimarina]|uniref:CDP-alcohol phosphatidyltransferase n=1 Tax=Jannaschia aquimarina TaxID=935700 RepID=A0A0D1EI96_9RHOB|nr:hypothetical protein [Jannaschia aquimarina]KIT16636.1 hypothetical protein jaqu_16030 [Jannaschia aquimarina]SNS93707.1 Phosphatidylglycerophosphate synthase [Jannaschia aquimarina]